MHHKIQKILVIAVLLLGVVLGLAGSAMLALKLKSSMTNHNTIPDGTTYQAVFLGNGQIYFGHLKNVDSAFSLLTDVYYVQQLSNATNPQAAKTGRLVKLGTGEAHAPTNQMVINQQQISFWENLTTDSPIVKTIANLQSQTK